jgi:hypothetical protein
LFSEERKKKTKLCFNEIKKSGLSPPETFYTIFEKMQNSDFCNGFNDRGWKADFDFVLGKDKNSVKNWIKIYEGKYDNRELPQKLDTWERNQINLIGALEILDREEQLKNSDNE